METEVAFLAEIKKRLTKRTFPEAVEYFAKCKTCSNFRGDHCSKRGPILDVLSIGWCGEWENQEGTYTYKFWTTAELVQDTYALIPKIPPTVDLVIGASRSGLIPAATIATALHRPLFSVGGGEINPCGSGLRLRLEAKEPKVILLVEDTVYNGNTLREDTKTIREKFPEAHLITSAVYVHPQVADHADLYVKIVPGRHYLEWNLFNSISLGRCIFDMDGILCEDISPEDDDDGERYIEALEDVAPKYLVRKEPIPIIATARLEKYRAVTESWLAEWGIQYRRLIMGPWSSVKERNKPMEISKFKAYVFTSYAQNLFIESDPIQAREIALLSGGEVLCPRLKRVFPKGAVK